MRLSYLGLIFFSFLIINDNIDSINCKLESNKTIHMEAEVEKKYRLMHDFKQPHLSLDECEVFCLQPDIRLCQCSKEELNKYMTSDMLPTSKEHKNVNMTLPHIYQSNKEKKTCGEYAFIIRKLNIAMHKVFQSEFDFYFEPTIDFQIESPVTHSVSNLFYWGDWIALYHNNPYINYDEFIPGCIWQVPRGSNSFHSTIPIPECRNQISKSVKEEVKKIHLCVWSYDRYWYAKKSGPCLCCELNFHDCSECFKCFKNNKMGNVEKLTNCLLTDKLNANSNENLSCYRCMNIKNPTYNCQSYEHYLLQMIQEYQIHNKYQVLASSKLFE